MRHNRARCQRRWLRRKQRLSTARTCPRSLLARAGHSQFAAQLPRTEAKKQNSPQVASRYFANGPTGLRSIATEHARRGSRGCANCRRCQRPDRPSCGRACDRPRNARCARADQSSTDRGHAQFPTASRAEARRRPARSRRSSTAGDSVSPTFTCWCSEPPPWRCPSSCNWFCADLACRFLAIFGFIAILLGKFSPRVAPNVCK